MDPGKGQKKKTQLPVATENLPCLGLDFGPWCCDHLRSHKKMATSSIEKTLHRIETFDQFLIFETPKAKNHRNKTSLDFGRVELVENENYISQRTVGLAKLMSSQAN